MFVTVFGITPATGGSKRFVGRSKRTGRAVIIDDCKRNLSWRAAVAAKAREAMAGAPPFAGPCRVDFAFYLPRPKSHYRANGDLREAAPKYHTQKPDALKLARSTEDALTGIVWIDDAQVTLQLSSKSWAARPDAVGVVIYIQKCL